MELNLAPTPARREPNNRFLVLDGEGVEIAGVHTYVLLVAMESETERVWTLQNPDGITTAEALAWLDKLPRELMIGYSLGYDWQMILSDLPDPLLYYLHHRGSVRTDQQIEWLQHKVFRVAGRRWYDVFAYFQTSFVAALVSWGYPDAERLERIKAGKANRSHFTLSELTSIADYNLDELRALIWLFDRLRECVAAAEVKPQAWYGPGALAAAVLKRERIPHHLPPYDETFALAGYYGGRFDLARAGWVDGIHSYDIHSAYPYAMLSLPSLAAAELGHVTAFDPDTLALWHVRWECPQDTLWPPFPWRTPTGNILYPTSGEGWYWTPEVSAALQWLAPYIYIDEGLALYPQADVASPFAFVAAMYAERLRLKRVGFDHGGAASGAYRLILNSLYGKLAQNLGAAGKRPPYQSFTWAGLITSVCRAMVLDAALSAPEHVIAINTDGILSDAPLPLPVSDALGDWEYTNYARGLLLQPGLYLLEHDDGTVVQAKSRGFEHATLPWDRLIEAWDADGITGSVTVPVTQFVSIGQALASDMGRWRTWESGLKRIRYYPSWRFAEDERPATATRLLPTRVNGMSTPYKPAETWVDADPLEELDLLIRTTRPPIIPMGVTAPLRSQSWRASINAKR